MPETASVPFLSNCQKSAGLVTPENRHDIPMTAMWASDSPGMLGNTQNSPAPRKNVDITRRFPLQRKGVVSGAPDKHPARHRNTTPLIRSGVKLYPIGRTGPDRAAYAS